MVVIPCYVYTHCTSGYNCVLTGIANKCTEAQMELLALLASEVVTRLKIEVTAEAIQVCTQIE